MCTFFTVMPCLGLLAAVLHKNQLPVNICCRIFMHRACVTLFMIVFLEVSDGWKSSAVSIPGGLDIDHASHASVLAQVLGPS